MSRRRDGAEVRVWDPLLRVLHVLLVAGIGLGWATTVVLGGWHLAVGWVTFTVVAVRIAWGFVGPPSARFAGFVRGPAATLRHAALVAAGREPRHLGHNPLGAWMILAVFADVILLAGTGWLYRTDRFWGDETVEAVHVFCAWTLVVLTVLHLAGVALASLRHRENLLASMVHGRKRAAAAGDIGIDAAPSRRHDSAIGE